MLGAESESAGYRKHGGTGQANVTAFAVYVMYDTSRKPKFANQTGLIKIAPIWNGHMTEDYCICIAQLPNDVTKTK